MRQLKDPIAGLINSARERIEDHIVGMVRHVILFVDGVTVVSNQLVVDYINEHSDRYELVCAENSFEMIKYYYIKVDGIKRAECAIPFNILAAPFDSPMPEVRFYG